MWGERRLFWQPGKWSLLRMVFFPSTDPPLCFITCSGSLGIDMAHSPAGPIKQAALHETINTQDQRLEL